jgi:iron complex outermembrane recepter protein
MKKQRNDMVKWVSVLILGIFLLLAAVPPALHAQPVEPAEQMEDIDLLDLNIDEVVTGMRGGKRTTKEMPYAVSVVTAEDIRRAGSRSVPDALRLVPGVDVADLLYGYSAVSPRGYFTTQSNQALVLVDGRQLYDSFFGGTVWGGWPFQLEDIERIEVIRGPAGVTWGANATNGLINIVTKDPAEQLGTTVIARAGSRGSNKEYLGSAVQDGKLRIRASAEYEGSDGFNRGGNLLKSLDDDYHTGRFGLYGIYDKGPRDSVTFSAGSDVTDGMFNPGFTQGSKASPPGTQANYAMARWDHKIEKDNSFNLTGFFNDFYSDIGEKVSVYRYQQFALQFGHNFKPAENHHLSWGIDTRMDLLDDTLSNPGLMIDKYYTSGVVGTYLQDTWQFAPKWALELGGRIDYDCYGGFQPSARSSLSYEIDKKSMAYIAVSRAFEQPTIPSRYADVDMLDGLMNVQGDKNTSPTSVIAYELGYRRKFFDRLDTKSNLYWHEYANTIGMVPRLGLPNLLYMNSQNIGAYSTYGFEFESKYAVTKKLSLLGNYTLQFMNWRGDANIITATDSISLPKHKFMVGPRYDVTPNFHLSGQLWFVDHSKAPNPGNPLTLNHIDDYTRLDLRAEYEFWKKQAAFAVGVSNLLQPQHYEGSTLFLNNAQVPRMIYAEIRITFK